MTKANEYPTWKSAAYNIKIMSMVIFEDFELLIDKSDEFSGPSILKHSEKSWGPPNCIRLFFDHPNSAFINDTLL